MNRYKIFIITLFIFIAMLTSPAQADRILDVPLTLQEHSMWCWAATTAGVLHYYGNDAVTQADVANYRWGRDDCDTGNVFEWDHICNNGSFTTVIQDNLLHWGVHADYIDRHFELSEVSEEINAGRPFTIRYNWKNGGAHHVIGRGLTDNMVHIMDPWPDTGDVIRTYESTVESFTHVWSCGLKTNLEFKDNWDETITDTVTGDMWQRKTGYNSDPDSPTRYSHGNAQSYCENLKFAGYSDWRLPEINQLQRLAVQPNSPAIQPLFNNHTLPDKYWSDTSPMIGSRSYMNFEDGSTGWGTPSAEHYVHCVRTGQYGSLNVQIYPEEVRSDAGWSRSPHQEPFPHDTREYWIPVGNHSIQFTPVPGYETPVPINIIIANNIMHTLQVTYAGPFSYPLVTTLDAIDITNNFARLRSEINPQGSQTQAWFAYAVQSSPAWQYTTKITIGSGTETVNFNPTLSNLECDTSYIFQARAENAGGAAHGEQKTFTTDACPPPSPSVTTLDAGKITQSSAVLRGTVNPKGADTEAWFQYREQASFIFKWRTTSRQNIGFGETDVYIEHNVQDLQCGTTYEFRAAAENAGGTAYGEQKTFMTAACPVYYSLSVDSQGASGVAIASKSGHGGTTDYTRQNIAPGTDILLEAQAFHGSGAERKSFSHWSGCISSKNRNISFSMDSNKTCTVSYMDDPQRYSLQVISIGAAGVDISSDTGHGGITEYTIHSIKHGTEVLLIAPEFHGAGVNRKRVFQWVRDNGSILRTPAVSFTMDDNKTKTVYYIDDGIMVLPGVLMLLLDEE